MERHIELTSRLQAVADFVPSGVRFADIGTDHGFLPVSLLQSGKIQSAIAADIRPGPLSRARATGESYGMGQALEYRLCDGLVGIKPQEVDVIAIAGMGGETIIHILSNSPWALEKSLILQPMSTQSELRQYLWTQGMTIQSERTICEGELLYNIMFVQCGAQHQPTRAELWAGRQWQGMDDPLRGVLLQKLQAKLTIALDGVAQGDSPRAQERRQELREIRAELAQMEEEWTQWQR